MKIFFDLKTTQECKFEIKKKKISTSKHDSFQKPNKIPKNVCAN